jgi:hypothetical protein
MYVPLGPQYSTMQSLHNVQDNTVWLMIQYPHVSLFSTVISNEFAGEGFYLNQHSMDGYEAIGFDVTQVT